MKCEGCGAELASSIEVYGGFNQAFCSDCWYEEQELTEQRKPLEQERRELLLEKEHVEVEMDAIEDRQYFQEEYGAQQKSTVAFDLSNRRAALFFRISDIEEELETLTLAYQRKFSVIGRA